MEKKKVLSRKVIAAVVLGVGGVAAALGIAMPEEQMESIINVVMMVVNIFG